MMWDFLCSEGMRNFRASAALLIPEAVKLPDAKIALWVREGSLILKLTKGVGLIVTVLKEETRRPVGWGRGEAILSSSESRNKLDLCDVVRDWDRMIVSESGARRMMEVISLWRREEFWEGLVTPVCGGNVEEPSSCEIEGVGWGGVTGPDSSVASMTSGLVVSLRKS